MKRLIRFVVLAVFAVAGQAVGIPAALAESPPASHASSSCTLGNGVQHVIEITFDNVHFFRDNPNVPSDLELMPHLLQFIEQNGTLLSNNHTPLIAHTANDSLTTYTGLYGDRHGMPISNSYNAYNANGTTDPAGSFAYWTDPIFNEASPPTAGHDTNPSMVYAAAPPATSHPAPSPSKITPAPWVSFTRAGCNVGDVSTANMVLENTGVDIPKVFGASSPETAQLNADGDSFKDAEAADYVGLAVHCAKNSAFCSTASGVKFGQTVASPTQVADVLPNEPGGYNGFNALFGHRYIAPQVGAGTPNLTHNGFAVTNAAGNLVDLNGNQINGGFISTPGFPGFGPINTSQTMAYIADLQESGVPVTFGYIADIHGNEHIKGVTQCQNGKRALGAGDPCYVAQAQYYDAAFAAAFQRLAADGITPANTEFIFSSDEGDHQAAGNVGRAVQPTPAGCDGAKVVGLTVTPDVACTYPAGTFGELSGNLTGLIVTQKGNTTPFSLENDSAPQFYVTGNPSASSAAVRQLEKDAASVTANNPYSGHSNEVIANYLADPTEEAILHMVNADPARTPTFSVFGKPDYYLQDFGPTCSGPCVSINTSFAWDHGAYAPEINTNWVGFAGPGVTARGLDGSGAAEGPSSAGPNSGNGTIPASGTKGTWTDETDIRPTLIYLTGLEDDYTHDGRVITELLSHPKEALRSTSVAALGACYKQLNSSVGQFGTATLQADTAAIKSTSAGDKTYTNFVSKLKRLDQKRDQLTSRIKGELENAAFEGESIDNTNALARSCAALIEQAKDMAA
jgi:hypothetical protein